MTITEDEVTFTRKAWETLKANEYFREVLEVLEDIELLEAAKAETEYFVDYEEYRNSRLQKLNV